MKNYQQILIPYAYNILGSLEDAKDAIQDVILKYTNLDKAHIENEKAYLIKSVINHSINIKERKKKFQKVEVWLPEPITTEESDKNLILTDLLSYSLLILLENLNPKERAVYILKSAFNYSHEDIAKVLNITSSNSRKIYSRAKIKLNEDKSILQNMGENDTKYLEDFIDAVRNKDLVKMEQILTDDVAFYADGGEKIPIVAGKCFGLKKVSELLIYVYHKFNSKCIVKLGSVNHNPCLFYFTKKGKLKVCQVIEISNKEHKIKSISSLLDPKKLVTLEKSLFN
ncbi:sigma-70 family RNA polymerase sigma factor [Flavivirga sp. 57AJ16]|uniref:sigma-70 family RNA polymerase sigma factor n=1 Tax=Flavivirga sp. 57AJ16 TaxID=3025307 RepID=UPI0023656543|nr:sigma-70 family RNA polymerase sigma factor [Flavivirga sp. 57AJ16]MDD7886204.1 sigma-70 family RNA polymerase sigma factor [Flavivirga sp. 57AJ16]